MKKKRIGKAGAAILLAMLALTFCSRTVYRALMPSVQTARSARPYSWQRCAPSATPDCCRRAAPTGGRWSFCWGVPYRLEEPACTICIDRFWRADSLSASAAVDALATRTCADRDHRMLIAEGWIENEDMVELYLPDVLRASFTCGDGPWTAVALVERNGGTELGSVLAARTVCGCCSARRCRSGSFRRRRR